MKLAALLTVLLVLAPGCGGSAPPAPAAPAAPSHRQELDWLLALLARDGHVTEAELGAHFDAPFLARAPVRARIDAFVGLAAHMVGFAPSAVDDTGSALVAHGVAGGVRVALVLSFDASGRIHDLDVRVDPGPKPTSFEAAARDLAALAPRTQLLVAALDGDRCRSLHERHADDELAIASGFKLYVLLGLADAVLAGRLHWDDVLAMRDDWRSLPGGVTQDDPPGTSLTVRTLAERMISISDNTAADVLLYTVGRAAVEAALVASGHARPALDVPFLGTRELFWLKMALPAADVDAYLALPAEARRRYLEGLAGKHPPAEPAAMDAWTTPRWIDSIEWFASARDLCGVAATLRARAEDPRAAPLLEVLAKNPGLPADPRWPYVGFKGGSEPGVLSATWLLRRDDGRWFVVSLGANGPAAIDEGRFVGIAAGVVDLLARDGH